MGNSSELSSNVRCSEMLLYLQIGLTVVSRGKTQLVEPNGIILVSFQTNEAWPYQDSPHNLNQLQSYCLRVRA